MQPSDDFYMEQAIQFMDLSTRTVEEIGSLFWRWCESKDFDAHDMQTIWEYVEATVVGEEAEATEEQPKAQGTTTT